MDLEEQLFLLFMSLFWGVLVRHCAGVMSWLLLLPTPPALMPVSHITQGSGSAGMTSGSWASLYGQFAYGMGAPGC